MCDLASVTTHRNMILQAGEYLGRRKLNREAYFAAGDVPPAEHVLAAIVNRTRVEISCIVCDQSFDYFVVATLDRARRSDF